LFSERREKGLGDGEREGKKKREGEGKRLVHSYPTLSWTGGKGTGRPDRRRGGGKEKRGGGRGNGDPYSTFLIRRNRGDWEKNDGDALHQLILLLAAERSAREKGDQKKRDRR